ncbi:hypothetical protein [Pararhizobium sp.]|uniref:hypothetical protein n=1 Tax=Pararhizobium sp. TaxID=1977563 RepID=UPI003D100798
MSRDFAQPNIWARFSDPVDDPWDKVSVSAAPQEDHEANPLVDVGEQAVRGVNVGLNDLISLPGAIVGGAADLMGFDGDQFRWNNQLSRFMANEHAQPQTDAGRFARAAGRAVGASAVPTAGVVAAAPGIAARTAPATTTLGNLVQQGSQFVTRNPGTYVAAEGVAATGAGLGQQTAAEMGAGPVGQTVGALAGGIAPFAVARPIQSARHAIETRRGMLGERGAYNRLADRAREDGLDLDEMTSTMATGATARREPIQVRTMEILGEEMVNHGGNQQTAIQSAIARIQREVGVAASTAEKQIRRLIQVHSDNPLFFSEYPAVARANQETRLRQPTTVNQERAGAIADTSSHRAIEYLGNASTMGSASATRNAVMDRMGDLRANMLRRLQAMSPDGRTIDDADQMLEGIAASASQEYRRVHNNPRLTNYNRLWRGLSAALNTHLRRLSGREGEQVEAMQRAMAEFFVTYPDGSRSATPTLQQLQDMRGALRGMIERARGPNPQRPTEPHIIQVLQPLYDDVTRVMQRASPRWAAVNQRWADLSIDRYARDLGESLSMKSGTKFRDQMREFNRLAPNAQDYVRIEFVQQLLDKIENAGSTHDLAKLFNKPHVFNMVRTILGRDNAMDFRRIIGQQQTATMSRNMLGNSRTQPRQAMMSEEEADVKAVVSASQGRIEDARLWLLKQAQDFALEGRRKAMAEISTTRMQDVPRVAQHLEMMRRYARLRNRIRADQTSQPVARFVAPLLTFEGEGQTP